MNHYLIKPMQTKEEMQGKAYVHYQSWQETYAGLIDSRYLESVTLDKCTEIARRYPDGILVAKEGETVIGFAGYGPYRDASQKEMGEIFSLYVLAAYHGRRVGYELVNAALAELLNDKKIAVWVLDGNEKAIRFYERHGFRFDGVKEEICLGAPRIERRMIYERPAR